ncbi:unnamed protein product [Arabidopsis lyrata]|uniref:Predicted protein n=1 Tax=Arabidopsis lyrata subsp. lyrata TaxID=81972 RepID=D7KAU7_ARALL|nr:uncharacterized protein LOC9327430 [Arabidopsis lyrata subsp. lyrata]XP_020870998.1 uncharacterized protein LOC9327430 [Arabidopsis lyrata subsp. lyrata]XP_020870999.1 uncharacterized protein LOC9327430 [Arabidopsis lyrata subsp. lyrata]XP_020871000.1 uncharacterized protein LOC9327430 [Arabidopsis lyrata subsp. lyrata]CAH8254801.1 unnamed protein product [Arabidopsis lyrata]EFH67627.1 predicted protein [Arabidopsis lyrata subsp. lyrata]|eukprot:XP_002891368.1 uncharacterized protein LOC9327430 [Arabidopsis lyrata subsp. lyrata]
MPRRRLFAVARTFAFWDVHSWHPSKDSIFFSDPGYIGLAFRLPLYEEGVRSLRSIDAYCGRDMFSEDQMLKCEDVGINVMLLGNTRSAFVNLMLWDIASMARSQRFGSKKPNLVVFSKISEHTEMMTKALVSLRRVGCNVLFAMPNDTNKSYGDFGVSLSEDEYGNVSLALLSDPSSKVPVVSCPDLFDKEKVLANVYDPDEEEEEEDDVMDVEEVERRVSPEPFIPPEAEAESSTCFVLPEKVGTCVFWDVQDYQVPLGLQPETFIQNIKTALGTEDDILILAYGADEKSFPDSYRTHSIFTSVSADKYTRLTVMMVDIICWVVKNRSACPNLLVIANASVEDPQFWPFLLGLGYRGFNIFATIPDTDLPDDKTETAERLMFNKSLLSWKNLSCKRKRKGIEDTVSGSDD